MPVYTIEGAYPFFRNVLAELKHADDCAFWISSDSCSCKAGKSLPSMTEDCEDFYGPNWSLVKELLNGNMAQRSLVGQSSEGMGHSENPQEANPDQSEVFELAILKT